MKKLFILIIIISCSLICIKTDIVLFAEESFYYTDKVEHLFTHCLTAFPALAFDKNNTMKKSYNNDCITPYEFTNILNSLYQNNYVLVNINDVFSVINGIAVKNKVKIPVGKKPLILSFDDVNYDTKKMHKGMVDKIILDDKGNLASQTIVGDKKIISYTNEFVPILESFVKTYPKFSINGAKATLNLTGYDGILGYRTSSNNTKNRKEEIERLKPVIKKLKENGWTFACHSYGHYHMKKISLQKFATEIEKWNNEVLPLIGKTKIYVYPYGEWEVFKDEEKCDKHKLLEKNGFSLFCGVGMETFYSYLPSRNYKVLFMDRKVIDGTTLRADSKQLYKFFNPRQVYDYKYRPVNQSLINSTVTITL